MTAALQFLKSTRAAGLAALALVLGVGLPRLTALNQYLIVDEADRWRWARDFVWALYRGDLASTLVGDGYPGIVPVWAESIWVFLEALRRSLDEGQWIGEPGLYLLFHQWDRLEFLYQQRLPIVLLNTALALLIIWAVWRLFGGPAALAAGLLVALDPFYLSDSRVNRAEAVITGLMTLSMLALVFYDRQPRQRYLLLSGLLGGLSFLTKIQALALLPAVGLALLLIHRGHGRRGLGRAVRAGLAWAAAAALTWFALWPAMWVAPLDTLALVYAYTTRKVGAEGVNLFFLGQTYENADPGLVFYPFVFLMRLTPLALLGLVLYLWAAARRRKGEAPEQPAGMGASGMPAAGARGHSPLPEPEIPDRPTGAAAIFSGSYILVIYILAYALVMSLGSHKQDRYLLPVFPSVDILAGLGLVYLWRRLRDRFGLAPGWGGLALGGLLLVQAAVVLPHHPYYYSYFNPLLGGGRTAVQTLRVGWGEGMDQVGTYLAAKPDSRDLVVSTRFTHNMLNFKGRRISLLPDGRWTQADYIVLYIQQVQRRQEPSPGFIDYFQARPPEHIVTIGGIDYAWVYPIPFANPADPQVSRREGQAALLGYSWEATGGLWRMRLLWENLGPAAGRQLAARLVGDTAATDWAPCRTDPAFERQAATAGAYVESLCAPALDHLPDGLYSVEFGLSGGPDGPEPFVFPQGWHAASVSAGRVSDTPEADRLAVIAQAALPAGVERLERLYDGRLKLAGYRLEPALPVPGQALDLTLYWQKVQEMTRPVILTVQLADSRSLPLGRIDLTLPVDEWLPGRLALTRHTFPLSPDLTGPLAGQVEVTLANQAEVALRAAGPAGEPLDAVVTRFTIVPESWPDPAAIRPAAALWQAGIQLLGYTLSPAGARAGEQLEVSLYWQTEQPVPEDYVAFIHLVDDQGQLRTQNDAIPRLGAYPTPWWLPGVIIEDGHPLALPPDLPAGRYHLLAGLYRSADGVRLPLAGGGDIVRLGEINVLPRAGGGPE